MICCPRGASAASEALGRFAPTVRTGTIPCQLAFSWIGERLMPHKNTFIRIVESAVGLNPRLSAMLAFQLGLRAAVVAKRLAGSGSKAIEHQAAKLIDSLPSKRSLPSLSFTAK